MGIGSVGKLTSLRVLVVEDDPASALLLERSLHDVGFEVSIARDGAEAWEVLQRQRFEAVLTDWMMPRLDGMRLIHLIRKEIDPPPWIVVITALGASNDARNHALDAGANDFVAKPFLPDQLARGLVQRLLGDCAEPGVGRPPLTPVPDPPPVRKRPSIASPERQRRPIPPPWVGVCIAASTGGPGVLARLVPELDAETRAAYFLVQHGPAWMLENFAARLQRDTRLRVSLARAGEKPEPGHLYLAPGNRHLKILSRPTLSLELSDEPTENFVRPAADPLFRSAAEAFGRFCVGVVLTGMGRDAAAGAAVLAGQGGRVIVQDPDDAVAPSMPKAVRESGVEIEIHDVEGLGRAVRTRVAELVTQLGSRSKRPGRPPAS